MKRNVISQGKTSVSIILPAEYVRMNNIRVGQELDVERHGATLVIRSETSAASSKDVDLSTLLDIDQSANERRIIDKILGTLFKQGADRFTILCPDTHTRDMIRTVLRDGKLSMYEEPGTDDPLRIVVHCPGLTYSIETLEQLIQVIIKQVYHTLEDLERAIREGTLSEATRKELEGRDKMVNDHADICRRLINREVLDYRSTSTYNFVDKWEKAGDAARLLVSRSAQVPAVARASLGLITRVKDLIALAYLGKVGFTPRKLAAFYLQAERLGREASACTDLLLAHAILDIVTLTQDAYSDLMVRYL